MDLHQYFDEAAPQTDSFEHESSLKMWKCTSDDSADSDKNASSGFDCNICLECVQDPVVTLCGHLYCWPCIYKWLNFQSTTFEDGEKQRPQCPVCKSEISQSSLVPLYGRGQTTLPSEDKAHQLGIVIPRRPLSPLQLAAPPRSSSTTPYYRDHTYYHDHPQQFNSVRGSYNSPVLNTNDSVSNTFNTTYGVIGETIYARVFGNQVTNIYTYPDTYHISGNRNPRVRRHLMEADKSLSRICFFLLCCAVFCLLIF